METSGNSSKKQKLNNAPESWVSNVNCYRLDIEECFALTLLMWYSYSNTPRVMEYGVLAYAESDPKANPE